MRQAARRSNPAHWTSPSLQSVNKKAVSLQGIFFSNPFFYSIFVFKHAWSGFYSPSTRYVCTLGTRRQKVPARLAKEIGMLLACCPRFQSVFSRNLFTFKLALLLRTSFVCAGAFFPGIFDSLTVMSEASVAGLAGFWEAAKERHVMQVSLLQDSRQKLLTHGMKSARKQWR